MDGLSVAANVVALYQLTSDITKFIIKYGSDVRQGSREMHLMVDRIVHFQACLARLAKPLDEEGKTADDRLRFLRDVLNEDSESFKSCKSDLEKLLQELEKLEKKMKGNGTSELQQGASRVREGASRLRAKLTWPFKEDDARRVFERMQIIETAINNAVTLDTHELLRSIDSRLKAKSVDSEERLRQEEADRKELEELQNDEKRRREVTDWLKHPNPSENHIIACSARNDNISPGRWLIEGPELEAYQDEKRSLLWLHGYPGCGKTVLTSLVIDNLAKRGIGDEDVRIAYWYFTGNDRQRMSIDNLFRALLCQLLPPSPAKVPVELDDLWTEKRKGRDAPKLSELRLALRQMLAKNVGCDYFVVIDALDEANLSPSDREHLLGFVEEVLTIETLSIHIYVTSRTREDLQRDFENFPSRQDVSIEDQVDRDIAMHVEDRLSKGRVSNRWPESLLERVKTTLVEKAGGMFRWVDCVVAEVLKCRNATQLDYVLQTLPTDLNEQYERELAQIPEQDAKDALRLLEWLTFPQRKLRMEEAVEVLAVSLDLTPPRFVKDMRMFTPRDVLNVCSSMVRTDFNKDGRDHLGGVAEVETLTTAHSTVLEFLQSRPIRIGSKMEFTFQSTTVNLQMAETCLIYLRDICRQEPNLEEHRLKEYPFARYCAEFWGNHYREAMKDRNRLDFSRIDQMIIDLLEDRTAMLTCVRLCDPDNEEKLADFSLDEAVVNEPIYYAALYGLRDLVEYFIQEGADLNNFHGHGYGTPLIAAVARGYKEITQLLLNAGADPMIPSELAGYSLAVAVGHDHIEIVELLLRQPGVDINSRRMPPDMIAELRGKLNEPTGISSDADENDSYKFNASFSRAGPCYSNSSATDDTMDFLGYACESMLYTAAENGAMQMVQFLLKNGANPNIEGGTCCTALITACRFGNEAMVDLLLQFSAHVDIYGGWYGSALGAACYNPNCLSLVKKLLAKGIDVNVVDPDGETPLWISCFNNEADYVDVLLAHGARVKTNAKEPLNIAASLGYYEITEKLICAGADVYRKLDDLGKALYAACDQTRIDVARLLLQHGADPNLTDCGKFDNCLQNAANHGNEELVTLLLEYGARTDLEGGWFGNCLHASINGRKLTVVKKLVDAGASVNVRGGRYSFPLILATRLDELGIIQWLLENGANPNVFDDDDTKVRYHTPLQACNSVSATKLLLDHGAAINSAHPIDGTALHTQTIDREPGIVRLLLERGADPAAKAAYGFTPLMKAVQFGNVEIVKILVEKGADANDRNNNGQNAITLAILAGQEGIFKFLCSFTVKSAGSTDIRGVSDLHYAANSGRLSVVEYLIDFCGQDPHTRDLNGWTTLHWAAKCPQGSLKVIKKLLAAGVDKDLRDDQGRTALDIATSLNMRHEASALQAATPQETEAVLDPQNSRREFYWQDQTTLWVGYGCDACTAGHGDRWRCKECRDCDLCFRCIIDKEKLHDASHEFEIAIRGGNGFPGSAQDPDMPKTAIPEDPDWPNTATPDGQQDDQTEKMERRPEEYTRKTPRLQTTSLVPSEASFNSPDTPLNIKWLNSRFRPDSTYSTDSLSPPPVPKKDSFMLSADRQSADHETGQQTALEDSPKGTDTRISASTSYSEYSIQSDEDRKFQLKPSNVDASQQLPAPSIRAHGPSDQEGVSQEVPLQEETEVYGPFGLRADTSPRTPIGHFSTFPIPEKEQSAVPNHRHSSLSQDPVYLPHHQPEIPSPPPDEMSGITTVSELQASESVRWPREQKQLQSDVHIGPSEQPDTQPVKLLRRLPTGLQAGNGARRLESPPKSHLPNLPQSSSQESGPEATTMQQESRPPARIIPLGLLPGRRPEQGSSAGSAHTWENHRYSRNGPPPPLPPKPGQPGANVGFASASSEGRFPLHLHTLPGPASTESRQSPVSQSPSRPQPPPAKPLHLQQLELQPRPAYAHHQHSQSFTQGQRLPQQAPRPFQQAAAQYYPPRQSSLDKQDSPLMSPPTLPSRLSRHSVIGLGAEAAWRPSPIGGPESPFSAGPGISPMSSSPGSQATAVPSPLTSASSFPHRSPLRPSTSGSSESTSQLEHFALPAEISLGFGPDTMDFNSPRTPVHDPIEPSSVRNPPKLSSTQNPPFRAGAHELDTTAPTPYELDDQGTRPRPVPLQHQRGAPRTDATRSPRQSPEQPRARAGPAALEPSTPSAEKGGAAARITAAAARVGNSKEKRPVPPPRSGKPIIAAGAAAGKAGNAAPSAGRGTLAGKSASEQEAAKAAERKRWEAGRVDYERMYHDYGGGDYA